MSVKELIIEGARQNNLKNISLRIPHNQVVAVTGVSGSGKSSLAFDTIFAEGQWRFIESLSTYARLFLEKLDRPDVDAIINIRPAIALEQKNPVRGSRSTVGTLTEIYDLLRLLYSKIAMPFCPSCGREIRRWDPSQVVEELLRLYTGGRAIIIFGTGAPREDLISRGFFRRWTDGQVEDLNADPATAASGKLDIVLDRLLIRDDPRLADSIELAWKEGRERIKVVIIDDQKGQQVLRFSADNSCEDCGILLSHPTPLLFSFNHPVGACPECKGFGNTLRYAEDLIIPDRSLSIAQGAVDPWNKPACRWWKRQFIEKGKKAGLDIQKPYAEFSAKEKQLLFEGGKGFYGINDFFEDLEGRRYKLHVRVFLARYRRGVTCPGCGGKRLNQGALAYRVGGRDIAELGSLPVSEAAAFFSGLVLSPLHQEISKELIRQIMMKLGFLNRVGLDYLSFDRYGKTLSGGEYQRINLANQLASQLTGTLYVLDEPTVGLHARDTERVAAIMRELADLGNTVVVVEHDRDIIESARYVVELGPGGGHLGGSIVFSGPADEFRQAGTLTSDYITGTRQVGMPIKKGRHVAGCLTLFGARGNNLKDVTFKVPLHRLTAVTGVSGSGKSSLVVETLCRALAKRFKTEAEPPLPFDRIEGEQQLKGVKVIDQSPIGRSPRSNPVTYLKIFDDIRKLFSAQREAKAYGYGPGFFSFNVAGGRCEHCKGEGYELLEMYFFENLYVRCEKCDGRRYGAEALRVRYRDRDISDILNMTVEEAQELFSDHRGISLKLGLLADIGLGYLRLGQSATTLSGGEAQRLKICAEMGAQSRADFLYVLDEPTVGLHFVDVQALLSVLNRLVEAGNTVIVIEHNLDLIRAADWIIDLGPEGGAKGGSIVFEGPPDELSDCPESYTGRYL